MSHSRKELDLTGQRFGKLTVAAPAANVGSRTARLWRAAICFQGKRYDPGGCRRFEDAVKA